MPAAIHASRNGSARRQNVLTSGVGRAADGIGAKCNAGRESGAHFAVAGRPARGAPRCAGRWTSGAAGGAAVL